MKEIAKISQFSASHSSCSAYMKNVTNQRPSRPPPQPPPLLPPPPPPPPYCRAPPNSDHDTTPTNSFTRAGEGGRGRAREVGGVVVAFVPFTPPLSLSLSLSLFPPKIAGAHAMQRRRRRLPLFRRFLTCATRLKAKIRRGAGGPLIKSTVRVCTLHGYEV